MPEDEREQRATLLDGKTNRRELLQALVAMGFVSASGGLVWGALEAAMPKGKARSWHKSVCRYCGTGCGVMLGLNSEGLVEVRGDQEAHNRGRLCIKGSLLPLLMKAPGRQLYPQIRENGALRRASWEEALELIGNKFNASLAAHGPTSVAYYGSGQLFAEESYTANKLFKGGLGSNNVDGNPRLCMASAAVGYTKTFGKDEPPGAYADIDSAHVFFIIGANPAECHQPLFERILDRKKLNPEVKLICVDPRRTMTADHSDLHLQPKPGSDLMLLWSMVRAMLDANLLDPAFVEEHVNITAANLPSSPREAGAPPEEQAQGSASAKQKVVFQEESLSSSQARLPVFAVLNEFLEDYSPDDVKARLGISAAAIREVAAIFASSPATMSLWTMGLNQRVDGVALNTTMNALHLLSGQINRPGATPLSLTGQANACGGVRDTGSLAHLLPHGRLIKNPDHRREMEKLWGVPEGRIAPTPGYDAMTLFEKMETGEVKCVLNFCTNPGQSLPRLEKYRAGLKKAFVVVVDTFENTRTTEYADVVLPAALYIEKEGVFGQSERRYQLVEKLLEPPGEAKSDLEILVAIADQLGQGDLIRARTPEAVWDEYRALSAHSKYNFRGMTRKRLQSERGIQW
ncbi:MAG: molybdopterin-dependent oxidoreductase, partial [Polyangiaceae bacterium]|nr:molybdopterin-dependent oxidoreductase [Polyangiaceae bacterium]